MGVAAARSDHVARQFLRRAEDEKLNNADLELIPQPLIKVDRILADVLKGCLGKDSEIKRVVDHEEVHWSENGKQEMSSPLILRMILQTFKTGHSLNMFSEWRDVTATKWLGDGLPMRAYMRRIDDLRRDLKLSDDHVRDMISTNMREDTKDQQLLVELTV